MTQIVLDASALIAALLGEPGEEKVRAATAVGAAFCTVNLSEVFSHFARRGHSRESILDLLSPLPIEIVPFDAVLAATTGMLVNETRSVGLSLGDRACLALAQHRDAQVLTADRAWSKLGRTLGLDIVMIR